MDFQIEKCIWKLKIIHNTVETDKYGSEKLVLLLRKFSWNFLWKIQTLLKFILL